jgi:hypothetical protein
MKRLILIATLAAGLTLSVLAQGAIPQPIYFWGNVAAPVKGPGQPPATEVVRPSLILLFADGSSDVDHLHWTGWGSSVAHAKGISSASNGIPNMAQGKRIKKPAQVTLSSPGPFQGHEVYRCFTLTVAPATTSAPRCLTDQGGYWFLAATRPKVSPAPTTTTSKARGAEFLSPIPNLGLSCSMANGVNLGVAEVGVACETQIPPRSVSMGANGRLKICMVTTTNGCVGNPGIGTPTLAYGKQVTVGPFRCRSEKTGVACIVIKSGKGFLINRAGVTPVGGATVGGATLTSALFFSPDRKVSCEMEDPPTNGYYVYCNASFLHAAGLGPDGLAQICNSGCLGMDDPSTPTLGYGKQITVGRFRCSSTTTGITCIVIQSRRGFLINDTKVIPVGL